MKITKEIEIEYLCHFHAMQIEDLPENTMMEKAKEDHECDYPESFTHDDDKCHLTGLYRLTLDGASKP